MKLLSINCYVKDIDNGAIPQMTGNCALWKKCWQDASP